MLIIRRFFKNKKIMKRIFKKKNNLLNNNVDNIIPITENSYNNETFIIKKNITNSQTLINPSKYIHNEGECLCFFILLILYYGSIIFNKIKKSFEYD